MSTVSNPFADHCSPGSPFSSSTVPLLSSWSLPSLSLPTPAGPRSRSSQTHRSSASSSTGAPASLSLLLPLHFQAAPRLLAQQFLPALRGVRDGTDERDEGVSEARLHQLLSAAVSAAHQQWQMAADAQRQHMEAVFQRKVGLWMDQMQERLLTLQRGTDERLKRVEGRMQDMDEQLRLHRTQRGLLEDDMAELRAAVATGRCSCAASPGSSSTIRDRPLSLLTPSPSSPPFSHAPALATDGASQTATLTGQRTSSSSCSSDCLPSSQPSAPSPTDRRAGSEAATAGLRRFALLADRVCPALQPSSLLPAPSPCQPISPSSSQGDAAAVERAHVVLQSMQRALCGELEAGERARLQLKADALQRMLRKGQKRRKEQLSSSAVSSAAASTQPDDADSHVEPSGEGRAENAATARAGEGLEESAAPAPPPLRRTCLRGAVKRKADAMALDALRHCTQPSAAAAQVAQQHLVLEFGEADA